MRKETISEAISNIKNRYIEEAVKEEEAEIVHMPESSKLSRHRIWMKWLPMAACICVAVAGMGMFFGATSKEPENDREQESRETMESIAVIPHWEDEPIYNQYGSVEWEGVIYNTRGAQLPADRIGEFLGEVTATGYDHYAEGDGIRTTTAKIYAITKLSTECAIAVLYEGTDTWYPCKNHLFKPQTVGAFLEAFNAKEEIVFGTIHYSYKNDEGHYVNAYFENVDDQLIWDWLLADLEAKDMSQEMELYQQPRKILGISVSVPLLGIQNIALSVMEDGYIKTNVVDTGALFYIGEAKTQAFVDYILNQCERRETVHILDQGNQSDNKSDAIQTSGASSPSVTEAAP